MAQVHKNEVEGHNRPHPQIQNCPQWSTNSKVSQENQPVTQYKVSKVDEKISVVVKSMTAAQINPKRINQSSAKPIKNRTQNCKPECDGIRSDERIDVVANSMAAAQNKLN